MKKFLKSAILMGSIATAAMPVFATPVIEETVAIVEVVQEDTIQGPEARTASYVVVGTGVRLRSKPGTSSSAIATLTNGEKLIGIGEDPVTKDGYLWIAVERTNGTQGWVAYDYLEER